jgi:hypothetical protein
MVSPTAFTGTRTLRAAAGETRVSHGERGDFVDYRQLPRFVERNHWRVTVFDTGALIYFEELCAFTAEYERFLANC